MTGARLWFLLPDVVNPSGGVWVVYRHVELLRRHGVDATVVHQRAGFRYPWTHPDTPVVAVDDVRVGRGDLLVWPDVAAGSLRQVPREQPVAVFNQNCYLSPWERPDASRRSDNPYRAPNLVGVVTTNRDHVGVLSRAFPHLDVRRVFLSVDPAIRADPTRKEALVTYMPRKNPAHAERVVSALHDRDAFDGLEVVAIHGRSHAETVDLLERSSVFLSFGHPEGWALPPAEAMAAGCVVVGYHGRGGREYWTPGTSWPVDFGDHATFVETAQRVLDALRADAAGVHAQGARAAAAIRAAYPAELEERSVVDVWSWALARAARRTATAEV